jgi:hypothetical protein
MANYKTVTPTLLAWVSGIKLNTPLSIAHPDQERLQETVDAISLIIDDNRLDDLSQFSSAILEQLTVIAERSNNKVTQECYDNAAESLEKIQSEIPEIPEAEDLTHITGSYFLPPYSPAKDAIIDVPPQEESQPTLIENITHTLSSAGSALQSSLQNLLSFVPFINHRNQEEPTAQEGENSNLLTAFRDRIFQDGQQLHAANGKLGDTLREQQTYILSCVDKINITLEECIKALIYDAALPLSITKSAFDEQISKLNPATGNIAEKMAISNRLGTEISHILDVSVNILSFVQENIDPKINTVLDYLNQMIATQAAADATAPLNATADGVVLNVGATSIAATEVYNALAAHQQRMEGLTPPPKNPIMERTAKRLAAKETAKAALDF